VKTVALVPINSLAAAKSRLNASLDANERGALVLRMAERVLEAVRDSEVVATTAVVSPDPAVLRWAVEREAVPLPQSRGDLNDGLELGRTWALAQRADAVLVLLGDLPCLTEQEVRELVQTAGSAGEAAAVLTPDRAEQGTNGLVLRPVGLMPFAFGAGSLRRHLRLARAAGVEPILQRAPGTCFDVDTATDLDELRACGMWTLDECGRHSVGVRPLAGEPG
jgi:2-phospho-L-lactate/phosphoenolpyruvate guanylyltransferase